MALAYFITFSTYGTRLHGTAKGSGSVDRQHNVYGARSFRPTKGGKTSRHTGWPTRLMFSGKPRTIVRNAIVAYCEEKNWTLLASHVRTNHVHVVLSAEREPGRLMSDLKARASANSTDPARTPTIDAGPGAAAPAICLTTHQSPQRSHTRSMNRVRRWRYMTHGPSTPRHERAAHEVSVSHESVSHESDSRESDSLARVPSKPLTSCAGSFTHRPRHLRTQGVRGISDGQGRQSNADAEIEVSGVPGSGGVVLA